MSSTYLYSDNDTTYDMSVSSTGTVLSYTDITTRVPLPSIQANANKYLKVRNDGQNLEWAEVEIGGGLELILDERTTSDPPSVCFEDTSGTKYNTGINMYRDSTNSNNQTISLYANNIKKVDVAENRIVVGTVANPIPLNVNGSFTSVPTTITSGSYSWNNLTSDVYVCNTQSGNISINLQLAGTENLGRKIRFYKSNTNNELRFFASGGNVRVNSPLGTQAQPNAAQFTNIPVASGFLCIYEIIRETTSNYSLQILEYQNNTDTITFGQIFRAGDGVSGTPSYSFANTTGGTSQGADTGMFYVYDTIDRLRFSAGGTNTLEMNANQSYFNNRLLANATGTNTTPSLIFHNDSSTTGYSGQRTNPSTDPRLWAVVNGVQSTELTPTQFNIGLNTSNNTNMKTLNQNGASNFNSFTPDYSLILTPTTSTANSLNTGIYQDIAIDEINGWYAYTANTSTAGQARLLVNTTANTLTAWTGITDSAINIGNVRHVAYGNGVWAVCSGTSGTRQLYYTTAVQPTTGWTQVQNSSPWTTNRLINRLKFVNGQFITLDNGTRFRTSIDCSDGSWSSDLALATGTFSMTDITYSPELQRYVAVATSGGTIFYYNGTTMPTTANQFTAVTVSGGASNTIAWSSKLGMFIAQNFSTFVINYSRDGINWSSYTPTGTWASIQHIRWVNDFGGFFMASVAQTGNNLAISRDGLNWSFIQTGVATAVYGIAYNQTSKVFLFTGTATTNRFKNALTDFNNYVDSDNIYNTFNSNVRFADVIEYQNQVITPVSGNNHFTISQFNRPEVVFDTASVNANIYLQGTSFNGRVGTKFKFIKSNNNHNVRIHGFETTTLISPNGNVNSFNAQSIPQVYAIIPAGYFGSFELSRVSDAGNGIWVIDNVDVHNGTGSSVITTGFQCDSTISNSLGSNTNPSYTFTGDTNTGFYSSGADTLDFTAGGTRIVSVDTSGLSILNAPLKPTNRIQYSPSNVQTGSFTISTIQQHLIRCDPGSTNDLVVTLDNVGAGTHYVITKETSTRALQVTASGSITYNGSNRNAVSVILSGSRGIWKIWQVSATDWYGEVSTF